MNKILENDIVFVIEGGWVRRWQRGKWLWFPYPKRVTEAQPITPGLKGDLLIPFDCKVIDGKLITDQVGVIGVDIWRGALEKAPEHLLSIDSRYGVGAGSTKEQSRSQTIFEKDVLTFIVYLAANVHRATVNLKVRREPISV